MAMEVCPSKMSLLFVILMGFLCPSHAHRFKVGGDDGWTLHPSENYRHWAKRHRFQINDVLVFKYKKGDVSVLVVNKDDYLTCNKDNPNKTLKNGHSKFKFTKSGSFFFISGHEQNCEKGQKLIAVVLSPRHRNNTHNNPFPPPTEAPLRPPSSSPSHSPTANKPPSYPLYPSPAFVTPTNTPPINPPSHSPSPSLAPKTPTDVPPVNSPSHSPAPSLAPKTPTDVPPVNSPSHSPAPSPTLKTPSHPSSHSLSPSPTSTTPTQAPPVEPPSHFPSPSLISHPSPSSVSPKAEPPQHYNHAPAPESHPTASPPRHAPAPASAPSAATAFGGSFALLMGISFVMVMISTGFF